MQSELLKQKEQYAHLERSHSDEKAWHATTKNELQLVSEERMSLDERFQLVQRILAPKPPVNEGVSTFKRLIIEDFHKFASAESSLADKVGSLVALQRILHELELDIRFPAILGKRVIGIAGGFSSGKSAFINSFLPNSSVKLAVGINPVTVIPSYIVCSSQGTRIHGYCANGGFLELGSGLYQKLSHEYLKSFGFDLRAVMPYISVQAPINQELFKHIALIDTPGYNPGAVDSSQSFDRETATEYVKQCDAMIWVIGLDSTGTLPDSDREFIEQAGFSSDSLFIVLNKADIKSQSDIDDILEKVVGELDFAGIEYAGICAYSSNNKKSYNSQGESLNDFVVRLNRPRNESSHLKEKIDTVFNRYADLIKKDLDNDTLRVRQLNKIKSFALEYGGTEGHAKMRGLCLDLEKAFPKRDLEVALKMCDELRWKFVTSIMKALKEADGVAIDGHQILQEDLSEASVIGREIKSPTISSGKTVETDSVLSTGSTVNTAVVAAKAVVAATVRPLEWLYGGGKSTVEAETPQESHGSSKKLVFLSNEWFAQVAVLTAAAGDLKISPSLAGVVLNITVTDTDQGNVNLSINCGKLEKGYSTKASTTLTMQGNVLRKVFLECDLNASMQAFMSGQIKAQGDMTKLMALQTSRPSAEQKALYEQILALV